VHVVSGRLPDDPPDDPVERDALAGEYVLGTLDARSAARVAAALASDAALRGAVAAWERRLAPLSALALPEAPPEGLWDRIDAAIAPAAAPAAALAIARPAERRPRLALWRIWAIGATLIAAAFAGVAYVPRTPAPGFMAVLVAGQSQPAFAAMVRPGGELHLAAMTSMAGSRPQAPAGKQWELWGMPPGAKAPTSLGLIPMQGGTLNIATPAVRPQKDMLIMISVEPPGGSPTGQPTGPVVFFGRLMPASNT
jgi:anti-sigma-K factor RskA